jgi:hypothetical protein
MTRLVLFDALEEISKSLTFCMTTFLVVKDNIVILEMTWLRQTNSHKGQL